jgi:hypothetical protein
MKLFVLLFIGFIGLEARANKPTNDDPAPGRSGPPRKFHEVETSHESYRPAAVEHEMSTTSADNRKAFGDIFSSLSSENVEYHENIHYYKSHEDFSVENTNSEKLLIDSENEVTDNVDASSASKKSAPLTLQQAQSRLALDNNGTHNSIAASLEIINSRENRCDLGAPNPQIVRYLKLAERVIGVDFNYSKEQESSVIKPKENTKNHMRIDVSHDVFETTSSHGGLLMGIIYKGKIYCNCAFFSWNLSSVLFLGSILDGNYVFIYSCLYVFT